MEREADVVVVGAVITERGQIRTSWLVCAAGGWSPS